MQRVISTRMLVIMKQKTIIRALLQNYWKNDLSEKRQLSKWTKLKKVHQMGQEFALKNFVQVTRLPDER